MFAHPGNPETYPTPGAAFRAQLGKRPDLFLSETRNEIECHALGQTIYAVFESRPPGKEPLIVVVGWLN
jgi:hypothetical protein